MRADSPDNRFIADELKWAGFRLTGLANNHALDFGAQGMFSTIPKFDRGVPSRFLQPFAHSMIDAGADAFIGHGPHVLRGIEIYKNKPIFYSLGNFIFHGESARQIPSEIHRECNVAGNNPSDVFDKVLGGFSATPYWQTVVPVATFENRKLTALRLYPVTLNPNLSRSMRGTPELAQAEEARQIIATIARLSEPFRTTIRFDSGVGVAVV